jgi:putative transposase
MSGERRAGEVRVSVHMLWWTAENADSALTPEIVERLVPYITRYAQTLGITVHAVGGTSDHLHILYDLPPKRTLDDVTRELTKTTTRFLRDVLNRRGFAWQEETLTESVGPENFAALAVYIQDNAARHASGDLEPAWEGGDDVETDGAEEEMPSWLREVLPGGRNG